MTTDKETIRLLDQIIAQLAEAQSQLSEIAQRIAQPATVKAKCGKCPRETPYGKGTCGKCLEAEESASKPEARDAELGRMVRANIKRHWGDPGCKDVFTLRLERVVEADSEEEAIAAMLQKGEEG